MESTSTRSRLGRLLVGPGPQLAGMVPPAAAAGGGGEIGFPAVGQLPQASAAAADGQVLRRAAGRGLSACTGLAASTLLTQATLQTLADDAEHPARAAIGAQQQSGCLPSLGAREGRTQLGIPLQLDLRKRGRLPRGRQRAWRHTPSLTQPAGDVAGTGCLCRGTAGREKPALACKRIRLLARLPVCCRQNPAREPWR